MYTHQHRADPAGSDNPMGPFAIYHERPNFTVPLCFEHCDELIHPTSMFIKAACFSEFAGSENFACKGRHVSTCRLVANESEEVSILQLQAHKTSKNCQIQQYY
jgi:hypothetical protein